MENIKRAILKRIESSRFLQEKNVLYYAPIVNIFVYISLIHASRVEKNSTTYQKKVKKFLSNKFEVSKNHDFFYEKIIDRTSKSK